MGVAGVDTKSIVYGTISIIIAVLVTVTILIPVVSESTIAYDTFANGEYYITMDKIDSTSEKRVIEWTKETNTSITVDGVEMTPNWDSVSIVATDTDIVRCTKQGGAYFINMVGATVPNGIGNSNYDSVTVTIEDGTIEFYGLIGDTPYTESASFTTAFCINPSNEGDYSYIMKTPTAKAYVLGDSEIYGIGFSSFGGSWQNIFSISGTIDDGITVSLVSTTLADDPVISNEQTVYETIDDHKNLYKFEKETFTVTYNDTDYSLTYSYVIVPAEVTAERSIHPDDATSTIINIIPLLVIVGIILGCVGLIAYRRL